MKRRLIVLTASLGALGVMLVASSSASAAPFSCNVPLDNFDRANSASLGTSWTLQAPSMTIAGNAATNPNTTQGLSTWNTAPPTQQVCLDVTAGGGGTSYAALDLGFQDVNNNAFLKVQGGAGQFSQSYFYYGNNGPGSCKITGGCSYAITPFHSARLHATLNPATGQASLDIDTNFDNNPEQTIVKTFNVPFSFGNAIGIGSYGGSFVDNFASASTPPPPPVPITPAAPNTKLNRATIKPGQRWAKFWFKAIEGTATKFECAFAKKGKKLVYRQCASPKAYQGLGEGRFTFKVRAVGPGGVDQSPVTQKFSI